MQEVPQAAPGHPISETRPRGRVRALFHGHLLADTGAAVLLREAGRPDRYYFPRDDVEMSVLQRSDHTTVCPFKGVATWFTLQRDRSLVENAAWSYEAPKAAAEDIRGMISFDPEVVSLEPDEAPGSTSDAREMSDYIRHTDSGSGLSQERHWEPTVSTPSDLLGEPDEEDRLN